MHGELLVSTLRKCRTRKCANMGHTNAMQRRMILSGRAPMGAQPGTHQTIPGRSVTSHVVSVRLKHVAGDVGHSCPFLWRSIAQVGAYFLLLKNLFFKVINVAFMLSIKLVLSSEPLMVLTFFYFVVPEIFPNLYLNCFYENTY
jgi:hypothetical protein